MRTRLAWVSGGSGRWQVVRRVESQPDEPRVQFHHYLIVLPTPALVDGQTNKRQRARTVALDALLAGLSRKRSPRCRRAPRPRAPVRRAVWGVEPRRWVEGNDRAPRRAHPAGALHVDRVAATPSPPPCPDLGRSRQTALGRLLNDRGCQAVEEWPEGSPIRTTWPPSTGARVFVSTHGRSTEGPGSGGPHGRSRPGGLFGRAASGGRGGCRSGGG